MPDTPMLALTPVAIVASDYPDKFGVPRQPGLATAARGVVCLLPPYDDPAAVEGLESHDRLWLSFVFDRSPERGPEDWRPRVRPPRLGGNRRVGVFATRSTHRPNRLGLSAVRLLDIATADRPRLPDWSLPGIAGLRMSRTHLLIGGHDLVAGTPVVDIKPYLPWIDACPEAAAGWAGQPPATVAVDFTREAEAQIAARPDAESLRALIEQTLAQDPRPAYRSTGPDDRVYGVSLRDVNVRFEAGEVGLRVCSIEAAG